jgi:hypothetical protein
MDEEGKKVLNQIHTMTFVGLGSIKPEALSKVLANIRELCEIKLKEPPTKDIIVGGPLPESGSMDWPTKN